MVAEVRAELEDFLGESGASYESVAAMVEEADRRMADVVYGDEVSGEVSFEYHDDHAGAELGIGMGH